MTKWCHTYYGRGVIEFVQGADILDFYRALQPLVMAQGAEEDVEAIGKFFVEDNREIAKALLRYPVRNLFLEPGHEVVFIIDPNTLGVAISVAPVDNPGQQSWICTITDSPIFNEYRGGKFWTWCADRPTEE